MSRDFCDSELCGVLVYHVTNDKPTHTTWNPPTHNTEPIISRCVDPTPRALQRATTGRRAVWTTW